MTAALDGTISLGVCSALLRVTLPGTITHQQTYLHLRPLMLTEQQCILTGLLALFPSTVSPSQSPQSKRSTSTPSTPHSLNLSTLHLGLEKCVSLRLNLDGQHPLFICHSLKNKCLLYKTVVPKVNGCCACRGSLRQCHKIHFQFFSR